MAQQIKAPVAQALGPEFDPWSPKKKEESSINSAKQSSDNHTTRAHAHAYTQTHTEKEMQAHTNAHLQ